MYINIFKQIYCCFGDDMGSNIFDITPQIFQENMKKLLGKNIEHYKKTMEDKPFRGIRINPIKAEQNIVLEKFGMFMERVPYEQNGYVFHSEEKIGNSPEHVSGMIYLQEPSSMMPVNAVELQDGAVVLDMCAAPGGKSTQIAQKIQNGVLVSNEIILSRAKILYSNIERLGERNTIVTNETPDNLAVKLPNIFDYVFVDAPCSGEGMFRKDPETIREWSNENIVANSKRQLDILENADKCLKQNGYIVYSTCTFSEIENEKVILNFLENHDYEVVEANSKLNVWTIESSQIKGARRFYPFSGKGEGQFVCVLKKCAINNLQNAVKKKVEYLQKNVKEQVQKFLSDTFDIPFSYQLIVLHDTVHIVSDEMISILESGINALSAGVKVCTIEKGIIKPHHGLFSSLGQYAKYKFELSDEDFYKYIHGEELEAKNCTNKMFYAMTYKGTCVGGAKCTLEKLKNYYPKGLRI